MNIFVMPKNKAVRFSHSSALPDYTIIISITNPGDPPVMFNRTSNIYGILRLCFDDVDTGMKNCMTEEDADAIYNFIMRHPEAQNIVVHCEAGISRSAGVGAALMKYFNGSDKAIFDNKFYYPNMTVYNLVLKKFFNTP